LNEVIDSKQNKPGDTFKGSVAQPLIVHGETLIPKGSEVSGTVVDAVAPGKFKGEGRLSIKLTDIAIRGVTYPITTAVVSNTLHGKGKRSAGMIGGGAGGGALIGGLAGGGKGAAIGALVGGAAGTAGATLTGNQQLAFTAESALTFKLQQPLTLKHSDSQAAQTAQSGDQPH
jgi:outer membrane lipoprotein SlyB